MTGFFDFVLWCMASIGAIALCLLLGQAIGNRIHPPPKVEEDDFARAARMLMEAQDEEKKLSGANYSYKNDFKLKANQCLQGILIKALDDAGRKKQKEVVHPLQDADDFSFLLKKKLRTYWKPKLKRFSHRWECSGLHRYYVHGFFLLQTKMATRFTV